MKKCRRFTLIESAVAIFILILAIDLIFDFFISSHKNSRSNDDSFALALSVESTLNSLDPAKYEIEDLKKALTAEALNNSLSLRGINWSITQNQKSALLEFYRDKKLIYKTELLLP